MGDHKFGIIEKISTARKSSPRQFYINVALLLVFIWAFARIISSMVLFGRESLQMDFSPYYTAGEALNQGLSPYKTYATRTPPVWDGVMFYTHSRFSYPPPAAILFRPWAALPYAVAKHLWMVFCFACVAGALICSVRITKLIVTPPRLLILAIVPCVFYPLLILLERGQVDAVTLLLLVIAVGCMGRKGRYEWAAGGVLAFATLLKMHCVFIFPFLLLRQKRKVAVGYMGGVAVIALSSLLFNGPEVTGEYVFKRLPIMSTYGTDQGSVESRLPIPLAASLLKRAPEGMRVKGGKAYKLESFSFVHNATVVRAIWEAFKGKGLNVSHQTPLALGMLFFLFALMAAAQFLYFRDRRDLGAVGEFTYWQAVFTIVLLAAPTTFVMNTVWLLPVAVIIFCYRDQPLSGAGKFFLVLCMVGFALAAAPDLDRTSFLAWFGPLFGEHKYIIAEFLIFLSLIGLLINLPRGEPRHGTS